MEVFLSEEQERFLRWLQENPGYSIRRMESEEPPPPGYSSQRLENMVRDGLVERDYGGTFECGSLVSVYSVSDKGRGLLEKLDAKRQKEAQEAADKRRDRRVSIWVAVWCAALGAVVGAVLTYIFEHFGDSLFSFVHGLFH